MDIRATQIELIEMLIRTQKESVLNKIKNILEQELNGLSEDNYKELDARKEEHLSGKSKSYSWEETRKKIEQKSYDF